MWVASMVLGLVSCGVALAALCSPGLTLEDSLFLILVTCYISPAGLTLGIVSCVRQRGGRQIVSVLLNGIYFGGLLVFAGMLLPL